MKHAIQGLVTGEQARALPVYCPEAQILRERLDKLLEWVCKPAAYKGPDIPALCFNRFAAFARRHNIRVEGRRVMDFGCGAARPIGIAALYYLAGASRVLAIDLHDISDQAGVAMGAVSTILGVTTGKLVVDFDGVGAKWEDIRKRAADFDLCALIKNDIAVGVPDAIVLKQAQYRSLPKTDREFDLLVSHSVFEHVVDLPGNLKAFRENISADGVMYIAIDYADHRIYAPGSNASRWQYLMDGNDNDGDINMIRHSAFLRYVQDAGFEIVDCEREVAVPSAEERAQFLKENQALSEVDVQTLAAHVILRAA